LTVVVVCMLYKKGLLTDKSTSKNKSRRIANIGVMPRVVHIEEGSSIKFERELNAALREIERQADIFDFKYDYSISYSNTNEPFYEWYSAVITFKYYE